MDVALSSEFLLGSRLSLKVNGTATEFLQFAVVVRHAAADLGVIEVGFPTIPPVYR